MSNHSHLVSSNCINSKVQDDDNNDSYPPSCQEAVRFPSPRPTLVETWLDSVRSRCSSNDPQNNETVGTPWDKTRSRQTSCVPFTDEPGKILQKTHTPACSSGLFIPVSPYLQGNPESVTQPILGESELELLQKGGKFRSERLRNCFNPSPRPEKRDFCDNFHRQPRRKTRIDRYDTKPPAMEDQERTDRPALRQDSHRMRRKRRLRSGKDIMKNFASDAVKKEHVIMRPHVAEDLLSEERPWNNTTLADLSFNNFDLGLSQTKLSTFSAADIDNTSRRSNILPESDASSPMESSNRVYTDESSKMNPRGLLGEPEQLPRVSKMGGISKGKAVDMESTTSLIGTAPLMLDNQITQESDSFLWQKNQPNPIIRATNSRQPKFHHAPSIDGPGQLELQYASLQYVADQDINEILQPGIYDDAYIPQLRSSEVSRNTLRQPPYEDTAQYDHDMSPCDGLITDGRVNPQLQLQIQDPTGDVTVHQNPQVRSQPPVIQRSVNLNRRPSRHLAYEDSQWGGGYEFPTVSAPLSRTIPVSPTSWAESVFPCIGGTRRQASCNRGSRTKAQFEMEQQPKLHGFGASERIMNEGMFPHYSDSELPGDRAFDTFDLTRRRLPNEMGLLQNDKSICSRDPNKHLHDKVAQSFDEDLHTVRSTENLSLLDGMHGRKVNKYSDVESWKDLDIPRQGSGMEQAKLDPSREKIDAPGVGETHKLPYGSAFKFWRS